MLLDLTPTPDPYALRRDPLRYDLRKKTLSAHDRIESGLTGRRLASDRRCRCLRASGQGREGRDP